MKAFPHFKHIFPHPSIYHHIVHPFTTKHLALKHLNDVYSSKINLFGFSLMEVILFTLLSGTACAVSELFTTFSCSTCRTKVGRLSL